MFRLLRLTTILLILCMGVIGLSRLIGSTQPNPIAAWFTNPDGSRCDRPCLFGIMPGVTKYDEAVRMLSVHPSTRDMQKDENAKDLLELGNKHLCVWVVHDQSNHIHSVEISVRVILCLYNEETINNPNELLTLGQVMTVLGDPVGVRVYELDEFGSDYFFFDGKLTFHGGHGQNVCISLPHESGFGLYLEDFDSRDETVSKWRGFVRRNQYNPYIQYECSD